MLALDTYSQSSAGLGPRREEGRRSAVQPAVGWRRALKAGTPVWGKGRLWPSQVQSPSRKATERACMSPTLFRDEMAKRKTVLSVRAGSETSSRGSKGGLEKASRTISRTISRPMSVAGACLAIYCD